MSVIKSSQSTVNSKDIIHYNSVIFQRLLHRKSYFNLKCLFFQIREMRGHIVINHAHPQVVLGPLPRSRIPCASLLPLSFWTPSPVHTAFPNRALIDLRRNLFKRIRVKIKVALMVQQVHVFEQETTSSKTAYFS